MLDTRLGGLRPWEMERLTPDEEHRIGLYKDELNRQAEGV